MSTVKIEDDDQNAAYMIFGMDDVEFTDPIKYYEDHFINVRITIRAQFLLLQYKNEYPEDYTKLSPQTIEDTKLLFLEDAKKAWDKQLEFDKSTILPENLLLLLKSGSKKEQFKLLEGLTISREQLLSFIFKAWLEYDFTFSQYKSIHYHNGFDVHNLPKLVYLEGNVVNTIGKTILSQGQLKDVLKNRKVIIAKFLDKGDDWHCFFISYKSLMGKEKAWKDGQPHFHYISSKFGMTRNEVLTRLKSKKYQLSSLPHIDLSDSKIL